MSTKIARLSSKRIGTEKENANGKEIYPLFRSNRWIFEKKIHPPGPAPGPLPDSCPQSFAIKIDRHAGNFGRHFDRCVASVRKCGNWCSSVLFSCWPDKTKPCVTSESNYSVISLNKKTSLAQLLVAMSCDEKNNKRRKKRSKQSSETNSHVVPKSVENREVRSDK